MRPFLILFVPTLVRVVIGMVSHRFAYYDAGDGKAVALFRTLDNLVLLFVALTFCAGLPRLERPGFVHDGRAVPVWITGRSRDRLRIRGHRSRVGDRGVLRIPDLGLVDRVTLPARSTSSSSIWRPRAASGRRARAHSKLMCMPSAPCGVPSAASTGVGRSMQRIMSSTVPPSRVLGNAASCAPPASPPLSPA